MACILVRVAMVLFFIGFAATLRAAPKTIAVVDFDNKAGRYLNDFGQFAGETLSTMLAASPIFRVLERDKLASLIREQRFSVSGLVDNQASAVRLGKLLGAEYLVTGSILSYDVRQNRFEGYGIVSVKSIYSISISIKSINTNTGVVAYADLVSVSDESIAMESRRTDDTGMARRLLRRALDTAARRLINITSTTAAGVGESPKKVRIRVMTQPQGAAVKIDGVVVAMTPAEVTVEEGVHDIEFTLAGFLPWTNRVRASNGLVLNLSLAKDTTVRKEEKLEIEIK